MAGWVQDVAPFGIFTTDADLVIRSWNQWLATHSGLAASQIVGRPLLEAYPELRSRGVDERYRQALQGEVSFLSTALHRYLLPFPAVDRDFAAPHMLQSARIAPLALGGGQSGTVTIIEDVTQREYQAQVLLRQQEHDRILSSASDALLRSAHPLEVMATLFPRIAAALRLDLYLQFVHQPETDELRLQSAAGITPDVQKAIAAARPDENLARRLGLGSFVDFPLRINDKLLGAICFGSYGRTAIEPDEREFLSQISRSVAIALDRTQREESLETRVAERTAKLNEIIEQLEAFSYTVAHDLRAPIRSLMTFSDILIADHGPQLPLVARDMLERIRRAGRRLDALTSDLLSYSRVGGKHVTLETVDVEEVVRDIASVSPALQGAALAVASPLGAVTAQRTLLQQCLSNLLDNALKFAVPDVPPRIVIRCESQGGQRRIWVEDNGIGIDPLVHQKIFDIFERIPGVVPVEGTGVGLAIVARATKQMGGTYGVVSTPGKGSRFWLQFPAAD